jgi:hypothetical protein
MSERRMFRQKPNDLQFRIYFVLKFPVKLEKILIIVNDGCIALIRFQDFGIDVFIDVDLGKHSGIEKQSTPVIDFDLHFFAHAQKQKVTEMFIITAIHDEASFPLYLGATDYTLHSVFHSLHYAIGGKKCQRQKV